MSPTPSAAPAEGVTTTNPNLPFMTKGVDGLSSALKPMEFRIYPNFNFVDDIVTLIKEGGGHVQVYNELDDTLEPRPPHNITLINMEEVLFNNAHKLDLLPNDGYDPDFVKEFVKDPKNTDLRKFRITRSNYKTHLRNANEILYQRISWNNLVRRRTTPPRITVNQVLMAYQAMQQHNQQDEQPVQSRNYLKRG